MVLFKQLNTDCWTNVCTICILYHNVPLHKPLSYHITFKSMLLSNFLNIVCLFYFTKRDLLIRRIVVKRVKDKSSTHFSPTADYSLRIPRIINETQRNRMLKKHVRTKDRTICFSSLCCRIVK